MSSNRIQMTIARIDHMVLTVADIDRTVAFYCNVLGMARVEFGGGRVAVAFGEQKINLHQAGHEIDPKATHPTPGSADLCLISTISLDQVTRRLEAAGVSVEAGPVPRTGATGAITSVYVRDPDANLVEIATYDHDRETRP